MGTLSDIKMTRHEWNVCRDMAYGLGYDEVAVKHEVQVGYIYNIMYRVKRKNQLNNRDVIFYWIGKKEREEYLKLLKTDGIEGDFICEILVTPHQFGMINNLLYGMSRKEVSQLYNITNDTLRNHLYNLALDNDCKNQAHMFYMIGKYGMAFR